MLGNRRAAEARPAAESAPAPAPEVSHPTKALQKFLGCLQNRERPVLVDLGPVVGSNVNFFGEQLGCRIRVEDIASDIETHLKGGKADQLPAFFAKRFTQPPGSVDGILCWDVFDYLDKAAAQTLASALITLLKPDGVLLGFFSTAEVREPLYTKYVVVDPLHLKCGPTRPAGRASARC